MSLSSSLFKLARLSADGRAVRKGRIAQRATNKIVGRHAGKVINRLWR
jgi:hypothetical protein